MEEELDLNTAREVYNTLCGALDAAGFKYQMFEDDLVIKLTATGEDLPMEFLLNVDAKRELVRIHSRQPFSFGANNINGAVATSCINNLLVDGSFDYNYENGDVYYRMTSSYRESLISPDLLLYMIACSLQIVDEYNDKLLMLAKNMITIEQFVGAINK